MTTSKIHGSLLDSTFDTYTVDPGILDTLTIDTSTFSNNTIDLSAYASSHSIYGAVPPSMNGIWTTTDTSYVNMATTGIAPMTVNQSGKISLKGQDADIEINGTSLKDFMQQMEQRLALLTPNPLLEKDWEDLKALGDQYRALEKEINEKMKTWDILKKE